MNLYGACTGCGHDLIDEDGVITCSVAETEDCQLDVDPAEIAKANSPCDRTY